LDPVFNKRERTTNVPLWKNMTDFCSLMKQELGSSSGLQLCVDHSGPLCGHSVCFRITKDHMSKVHLSSVHLSSESFYCFYH